MLRWKKTCIAASTMTTSITPGSCSDAMECEIEPSLVEIEGNLVQFETSDSEDRLGLNESGHIRNEGENIVEDEDCITTCNPPVHGSSHPALCSASSTEEQLKFSSGRRLLACWEDSKHLSPLHCFVRKSTEIFQATQDDIEAPAPGRKKKISLGQIGLRCIHCLHLPSLERVKRAVCFPSSIGRIYHSVSDMKFDHFPQCPELPAALREEFVRLKSSSCKKKKSRPKTPPSTISRSTAQYYYDVAIKMKLFEDRGGLFLGTSSDMQIDREKKEFTSERGSFCSSASMASLISTDSQGVGEPFALTGGQISAKEVQSEEREIDLDASVEKSRIENVGPNRHDPCQVSAVSATGTGEPRKILLSSCSRAQVPMVAQTFQKGHASIGGANRQVLPPSLNRSRCSGAKFSLDSIYHASGSFCQRIMHLNPQTVYYFPSQIEFQKCMTATVPDPFLLHSHGPGSAESCDEGSSQETCNETRRCLLATEDDETILNPLHCFARQNIEVFAATEEDIACPAPGRRNKILIGQVGIRCIHCCAMPFNDRVKRAACYPPTLQGIYHCVSNMKFDHFESCRGISDSFRSRLSQLKLSCSRRGGSPTGNCTAQYYLVAARKLGLVDTSSGIRFTREVVKPRGWTVATLSRCTEKGLSSKESEAVDGLSVLVRAATRQTIVKKRKQSFMTNSRASDKSELQRAPSSVTMVRQPGFTGGGAPPYGFASTRPLGVTIRDQALVYRPRPLVESVFKPEMSAKKIRCD